MCHYEDFLEDSEIDLQEEIDDEMEYLMEWYDVSELHAKPEFRDPSTKWLRFTWESEDVENGKELFRRKFDLFGHEVGIIDRTGEVVRVSDKAPLLSNFRDGKYVFAGFGSPSNGSTYVSAWQVKTLEDWVES